MHQVNSEDLIDLPDSSACIEMLGVFDIEPDFNLRLMKSDQGLNELAAAVLQKVDALLGEFQPDWLMVQGDTTTAMVGAVAAFNRGVRVGHIEAGLRSGNLKLPFPEEGNRKIISTFSTSRMVVMILFAKHFPKFLKFFSIPYIYYRLL